MVEMRLQHRCRNADKFGVLDWLRTFSRAESAARLLALCLTMLSTELTLTPVARQGVGWLVRRRQRRKLLVNLPSVVRRCSPDLFLQSDNQPWSQHRLGLVANSTGIAVVDLSATGLKAAAAGGGQSLVPDGRMRIGVLASPQVGRREGQRIDECRDTASEMSARRISTLLRRPQSCLRYVT
jgi:hypothetical protein